MLEKQAETMVVWSVQGAPSASSCPALAKERGTGYGPSAELQGMLLAGGHPAQLRAQLRMVCPRASKGLGLLTEHSEC